MKPYDPPDSIPANKGSSPPRELEKMQEEINSRCFLRLKEEYQEAIDDCQALQLALNYAETRRSVLQHAMETLTEPEESMSYNPGPPLERR